MNTPNSDDLIIEVRNHVAYLTLNRPRALNALSLDMVERMGPLIERWAHDPDIYALVSRGSGEKAYCAGGDVRGLYDSITGLGACIHEKFFIAEYTLDYQLQRFLKATGKPHLALLDGIVMGGGMGISQGATLRIVGERTRMAMPETRIGLFPDVGGSYFLSRARNATGLYLGLTSNTIDGADAIHAKLADTWMSRDAQAALLDGLDAMIWSSAPLADIVGLVGSLSSTAPAANLARLDPIITRHFADKKNVIEIVRSLQSEQDPRVVEWARNTAQDLLQRSPTLLEVTKRQIETSHTLSIADCLRRELGMMFQAFAHRDLVEGIRALVIDKSRPPVWNPATLAAVRADAVDAFFAPRWSRAAHPLANLETRYGA